VGFLLCRELNIGVAVQFYFQRTFIVLRTSADEQQLLYDNISPQASTALRICTLSLKLSAIEKQRKENVQMQGY